MRNWYETRNDNKFWYNFVEVAAKAKTHSWKKAADDNFHFVEEMAGNKLEFAVGYNASDYTYGWEGIEQAFHVYS